MCTDSCICYEVVSFPRMKATMREKGRHIVNDVMLKPLHHDAEDAPVQSSTTI